MEGNVSIVQSPMRDWETTQQKQNWEQRYPGITQCKFPLSSDFPVASATSRNLSIYRKAYGQMPVDDAWKSGMGQLVLGLVLHDLDL